MQSYLINFSNRSKIPTKEVPQANRLDQIISFVCEMETWPVSAKEISDYLGYRKRQGGYYGDAAELLGLIIKEKKKWDRTPRGSAFCKITNIEEKMRYLSDFAIQIPVVSMILRAVESAGPEGVKMMEIKDLLDSQSDVDKSTTKRRAEGILSWLQQLKQISRSESKDSKYVYCLFSSQKRLIRNQKN